MINWQKLELFSDYVDRLILEKEKKLKENLFESSLICTCMYCCGYEGEGLDKYEKLEYKRYIGEMYRIRINWLGDMIEIRMMATEADLDSDNLFLLSSSVFSL